MTPNEPRRPADCTLEKTLVLPSPSEVRSAGSRFADGAQQLIRAQPLIVAVVVLIPTLAAGLTATRVMASTTYPFQGLPALSAPARPIADQERSQRVERELFEVNRRRKAGPHPPQRSATRRSGAKPKRSQPRARRWSRHAPAVAYSSSRGDDDDDEHEDEDEDD